VRKAWREKGGRNDHGKGGGKKKEGNKREGINGGR